MMEKKHFGRFLRAKSYFFVLGQYIDIFLKKYSVRVTLPQGGYNGFKIAVAIIVFHFGVKMLVRSPEGKGVGGFVRKSQEQKKAWQKLAKNKKLYKIC